MAGGGVILSSRIPEIIAESDVRAKQLVERSVMSIAANARRHLIQNGSVVTGNLITSIDFHSDDYEGDVGTGVSYAAYVEYGTGERGAASHFEGKPEDIAYSPTWKGMSARPYLTPSVEEERIPFERDVARLYG